MEKLITIRTPEELLNLSEYIKDKEFLSFDSETTGGVNPSIIGFSVCAETHCAYYVITKEWNVTTQTLDTVISDLQAKHLVSELVGKNLIMQNAIYDCMVTLANYGIDLMPSVHTDTMILGHLLNENRSNGLKERGVELYGEDAAKEQQIMKESVAANGGVLTKAKYELYKADSNLIAHYGAKDAILTMNLFYNDVPQVFEEELDSFFYTDESMPLLRGPTYELNTTGLRVDIEKMRQLKVILEADLVVAEDFIQKEVWEYVKEKYPAVSKVKNPKDRFSITSNQQLAWLLFVKLKEEFGTLNEGGKKICKALSRNIPYSRAAKNDFLQICTAGLGQVWQEEVTDLRTGKITKAKKISEPEKYLTCDAKTLEKLALKYKWVAKLLEHKKNSKLLTTYVEPILEKAQYGIIRPQFMQIGTTSGRYSCKTPNFQNLPRDDKRIKSCIISRPGKVFVGSDYSQLEPRVFASFSGDERLLNCFATGDDFYSAVAAPVFGISGYSLKKDDTNSLAKKYPEYRQISKTVALSAFYGTTAPKMAMTLKKSNQEAQQIIDDYFESFPSVKATMEKYHKEVISKGSVVNLFGRKRRIPEAKKIGQYGESSHQELPYELRNLLNLAVNHPIQSTAASIVNRAAIAFYNDCRALESHDPKWKEVKLVLQVHDELVVECPESIKEDVIVILKNAMENTVELPGVKLEAQPKWATNLADLK